MGIGKVEGAALGTYNVSDYAIVDKGVIVTVPAMLLSERDVQMQDGSSR